MTPRKTEANRCVQLTDAGLKRLHEARRKYRKTIEDIIFDARTPSVNTVKRALRHGPVFLDTLERIWDFLRECAAEKKRDIYGLSETWITLTWRPLPLCAGRAKQPTATPCSGTTGGVGYPGLFRDRTGFLRADEMFWTFCTEPIRKVIRRLCPMRRP